MGRQVGRQVGSQVGIGWAFRKLEMQLCRYAGRGWRAGRQVTRQVGDS